MTFGWTGQTSSVVDVNVSTEMTQMFMDHCQKTSSSSATTAIHIDTARVYASGRTEGILGSVLSSINGVENIENIVVGSKAHPSWEDGGLSPKGIQSQFQKSISELNKSNNDRITISLSEYYLHQPDTENSLLDSLRCIHEMVSDGLIQTFGMSNYHVTEMKRAFELCDEYDLTKPTVCQSLYNPLNRAVERDMLPLLAANGCSFVAYNPLAAGLLTGKHHRSDGDVKEGRFKNNQNYLPRFYTDANFDAVDLIKQACDKEGVTLVDATFRWLLRHSALSHDDGILLGASSIDHLRQNLDACEKATLEGDAGQLSSQILEAFDAAATIAEKDAFPYWRSYSSDMPGRDDMDQGASYSAAKQK